MNTDTTASKPLGFWSCWSLTVGCMIGSGIFMLPAVLAPYGLISFGGWLITGAGAIVVALTLARLAARTTRTGGPYAYVHDAFGDLVGFVNVWGFWTSYWTGIPAVAIAFTGYLVIFVPSLADHNMAQMGVGLALIWLLTLVNIRGLKESAAVQLVLTVLKIVPLVAIIALGFSAGDAVNLPEFNVTNAPLIPTVAASALLTLWAFVGIEAGTIPAGACHNAARVIPRAIIIGTLTVVAIYLASTFAVMLLIPAEALMTSTAPFAEAARGFGAWGPIFIAGGALIATAGTVNGLVFCAGQLPMAAAQDKLAPAIIGKTDSGGAPYVALIATAVMSSIVLVMNYQRGLVGAFTFLIMLSTLGSLLPYLLCSLAELRHSWRSARGWAGIAVLAGAYSIFAVLGSGLEALLWGAVLFASGVPVYHLARQKKQPALSPAP